jgi:hypothetical protein
MRLMSNHEYSTGPIAKLIDPFPPMDDSDIKKVDHCDKEGSTDFLSYNMASHYLICQHRKSAK